MWRCSCRLGAPGLNQVCQQRVGAWGGDGEENPIWTKGQNRSGVQHWDEEGKKGLGWGQLRLMALDKPLSDLPLHFLFHVGPPEGIVGLHHSRLELLLRLEESLDIPPEAGLGHDARLLHLAG